MESAFILAITIFGGTVGLLSTLYLEDFSLLPL